MNQMNRSDWPYVALAAVAAFPIIYIGYQAGWSGWFILSVLIWGLVTAAVAIEIDRIIYPRP
jgi:hypothetical protein